MDGRPDPYLLAEIDYRRERATAYFRGRPDRLPGTRTRRRVIGRRRR